MLTTVLNGETISHRIENIQLVIDKVEVNIFIINYIYLIKP